MNNNYSNNLDKHTKMEERAVNAGNTVKSAGNVTKVAGDATKIAGSTTKAVGTITEKTGDVLSSVGSGVTNAGAKLSSTGVAGAIAGVPLTVVGGATKIAGKATKGIGTGVKRVGSTVENAGKSIRNTGLKMRDTGNQLKNNSSFLNKKKYGDGVSNLKTNLDTPTDGKVKMPLSFKWLFHKYKLPFIAFCSSIVSFIVFIVVLMIPIMLVLGIFGDGNITSSGSSGSGGTLGGGYSKVTNDVSYWWPIGSNTTTNEGGIVFASEQPMSLTITSSYGVSEDFRSGQHNGLDIGNAGNGPGVVNIIAAKDGVVTYPSSKEQIPYNDNGYYGNTDGGGFGNYVIISHNDGTTTVYAHLAKDSITVMAGDTVSQGQVIGKMGNSGSSTGTHLHFEVRTNGLRVDPMYFISDTNTRP